MTRARAGLSWLAARLLRQPLFANAGYLWGVTLVGALTGFFFWGLAARFYTPEEVGIASAIISAVALLAGIAGLGVGMGLVRFLPAAPHPRRLLNSALTFIALAALLVAAVYLAGLDLWSPSLSLLRGSALTVAAFLAFAVAQTLGTVLQSAFVARRRAGYALAQTAIANGGRLLLVVPLAGMAAAGLAGSVALAVVLAVTLSLALFLPRVEPGYRPRPRFHRPDLAAILPYSAGNYLAQLLAQTSLALLPLLVLELLGPAPAGYFYIAWMLGSMLASPGVALATSAFAEGSNAPGSLVRGALPGRHRRPGPDRRRGPGRGPGRALAAAPLWPRIRPRGRRPAALAGPRRALRRPGPALFHPPARAKADRAPGAAQRRHRRLHPGPGRGPHAPLWHRRRGRWLAAGQRPGRRHRPGRSLAGAPQLR